MLTVHLAYYFGDAIGAREGREGEKDRERNTEKNVFGWMQAINPTKSDDLAERWCVVLAEAPLPTRVDSGNLTVNHS